MPKRIVSRKKVGPHAKSPLLWVVSFFGWGILLGVIGGTFLFFYFLGDLPRPEDFNEKKLVESTKIYDRTGEILLYEMYGEEKRTVIPFDEIPDHLKKAIIATEDSNFYRHFGIDPRALIRSLIADIRIGKPMYGGSTITQQLIRSSYLTAKKSVRRKVREIVLALELELRYSKDDIFFFYLNQVPFGNNAYGVEAASQTYFAKPVKDISLPEAAVLAAIIQRPSFYGDPQNRNDLLARKNYVLERMQEEGYITQEEKEAAQRQEIAFQAIRQSLRAPHFVLYVRDYLLEKYGEDFLKENGLKVFTTLDWKLQQLAEKVVKDGAERNKAFNAHNAALVALNPKNGQILAMVGSKDYFGKSEGCTPGYGCLFDPQVNVATYYIGRQPGSAFKPFVYATAFKKGYKENTIVVDEPTNFGIYGGKPYMPQNYDGRFRGPVTLKAALAQSLNVPSVKVLAYLAGLEDSIKTAQEMGISTLTKPPSFYGLSLVLGGGEVKLLDMVSAYGVFAQEGLKASPSAILRIEDQQGNILEENNKTPERVLETRVARMINDILSDNNARAPVFGPNSSLYIPGYQVAAKSGTTQDFKDGWVIGYTPSLVVGVWAGNNNSAPMSKDPAVITAGPIWQQFMIEALWNFPKENFSPPETNS